MLQEYKFDFPIYLFRNLSSISFFLLIINFQTNYKPVCYLLTDNKLSFFVLIYTAIYLR